MLEKLISLVQYGKRKDIRLVITVMAGSVQIGVEKVPRAKGGTPEWLTSTHCGGGVESHERDADALAIDVLLELAGIAIDGGHTRERISPKRSTARRAATRKG